MRRLLRKVKRPRQPQGTQELRDGPSRAEPDTVTAEPTETQPLEPREDDDEGPHGPDLIHGLPPEVRRHLLSTLEFSELRTLVRASPVFHQQYRHDRAYFLSRLLEAELQSVTVDAYAVQKLTSTRNTEKDIPGFLRRTYAQRTASLAGRLTEDEVVDMFTFLSTIKAVIPRVMDWCLDENLNWGATPTEFMRLTRAMYRYQLLCLVADPTSSVGRRSKEAAVHTLVELFEPWEVEELLCFFQYAEAQYKDMMTKMYLDLPPDAAISPWDEDPEPSPHNYPQSLALRGLKLLRELPSQPYEEQLTAVRERLISPGIALSPDDRASPFSRAAQNRQRHLHPSERHRMTAERAPFPFPRDRLPDDKLGVDKLPPVAWTMIWKDTYSNLFGAYTADDFRRWGYVFWDDFTVGRLRGHRVLWVQMDQNWGGVDPRDMLGA